MQTTKALPANTPPDHVRKVVIEAAQAAGLQVTRSKNLGYVQCQREDEDRVVTLDVVSRSRRNQSSVLVIEVHGCGDRRLSSSTTTRDGWLERVLARVQLLLGDLNASHAS